jgi:predicted dehydrogenase
MEMIRWGILGTASIATNELIPAIEQAAGCETVAIGSRDGARAQRVAAEHGIPRSYGSYQEVLDDPEVDAVYIPLPNHLHAEWTIAAASSGKHVLCEKPIALDTAEADRMVAACRDAGVLLREAFMYRFHPSWTTAARLVAEGRIGSIVALDGWFCYFNDDPANIRNVPEYGGGALMDIGCYPIHASRMLLGAEPVAIRAAVRRDAESGVDIMTTAILEFEDCTATFGCSTRMEPDQRFDIYGTRGRISIEIPFNIPEDRPTRIHVVAGGDPPAEPAIETLTFETANQYALEVEAFADAIGSNAPLPDSGDAVVGNLRVIEKVFAAAGPSGWR